MGIEDSVVQGLWQRRLGLADSRKPKWILESFFSPLIVYVLLFLISDYSKQTFVFIGIAYCVYFFVAASIYILVTRKKYPVLEKKISRKIIALLYTVYDCATLASFSFGLLGIAIYSLQHSALLGKLNSLIVNLSIVSYVIVFLFVVFFRNVLLAEQVKAAKSNILNKISLGIVLSDGIISLGMLISQLLAKQGEYSLGYFIVYVLAISTSTILLCIWELGAFEIYTLYMHRSSKQEGD